jgi:hypothetical protein
MGFPDGHELIQRGIRNHLKLVRTPLIVIPAKAGVQVFQWVLDPGFAGMMYGYMVTLFCGVVPRARMVRCILILILLAPAGLQPVDKQQVR